MHDPERRKVNAVPITQGGCANNKIKRTKMTVGKADYERFAGGFYRSPILLDAIESE